MKNFLKTFAILFLSFVIYLSADTIGEEMNFKNTTLFALSVLALIIATIKLNEILND